MRHPIHVLSSYRAAGRPRRSGCRAALFLALVFLALAFLAACSPRARGPALLDDAALLTAPDREVLAERLALVTAGRYLDAHAQWSRRALLAPAPPATALPATGEEDWGREIRTASAALEERGANERGLERLARAYARAGWYREAHAVLGRAAALGPLSTAGEELLRTSATLIRFAAGADSIVAAARAGETGDTARAAASDINALADRLGLGSEALRSRRLYLGLRPPPPGGRAREVELSVIVHHEGPFPVSIATATVTARRAILDDNALAPAGGERPDWDPGSIAQVEDATLLVYHHRSDLRRAAARLFQDLERRGGRPPDAPADSTLGAFAAALRLRAASPLFDRARAAAADHGEARRQFAIAVMSARMAQVETAGARFYLDHADGLESTPEAGARRRLVAVLRHAPVPSLALADAADRAAHAVSPADDEAAAARAVVEKLRIAAVINESSGGAGDAWRTPGAGMDTLLHLSEQRLRVLAAGID